MSAYEGSRMQEEDERRKKFTSENQRKDEEKISLGELLLNAGYKIVEQDKELTRLRSELQQEREKVQFLLDELIYESRSEPGTYFMWGRSGGSRVPEKIMEIQKSKAK